MARFDLPPGCTRVLRPTPSVPLGTTDGVGEDFQAAGCSKRVLLKVQVLFGGGDPGVSDECHSPIVSKLNK